MNYTELRQAIIDWSTNATVAGQVDRIIRLAEARINDDLVVKSIERQYLVTPAGAVIFLPDDFHRLQRITYIDSGKERTIAYVAPAAAEYTTLSPGEPFGYTVLDQTIQLFPTPQGQQEFTVYYIPRIATIVGGDTNWLLTVRPDVYLYACLIEAAMFVKDQVRAAEVEAVYVNRLDTLKISEGSRFRPIQGNSMRISRRAV